MADMFLDMEFVVEQRLRDFQAMNIVGKKARQQPEAAATSLIPTTYEWGTDDDSVRKLLQECFLGASVNHDFKDLEWSQRSGICLKRLTIEETVNLGRAVIPMVASGFSEQGSAAIFLLSYQLMAEGTAFSEYVFGEPPELSLPSDKKMEELSSKAVTVGVHEPITSRGVEPRKEAAIYAYIAASMLRLFRISPASYTGAWKHIVKGFSKFYGEGIDVLLPTPTEKAMTGLALIFSSDEFAKVSIYRLLYMGNKSRESEGLKNFLYDIYLPGTGMHVVNIFLQLCSRLKCRPSLVLDAINNRVNSGQVECLTKILRLLKNTDENHTRRLWRYGRIFDSTFMADLQTKACRRLVYIMAEALRFEAPEMYKDILNISQLRDVGEDMREKWSEEARQLLKTIKKHLSKESESGSEAVSYPTQI